MSDEMEEYGKTFVVITNLEKLRTARDILYGINFHGSEYGIETSILKHTLTMLEDMVDSVNSVRASNKYQETTN
jgi:hypothetical protein